MNMRMHGCMGRYVHSYTVGSVVCVHMEVCHEGVFPSSIMHIVLGDTYLPLGARVAPPGLASRLSFRRLIICGGGSTVG